MGLRKEPLSYVHAKLNGRDVRCLVDCGACSSLVSRYLLTGAQLTKLEQMKFEGRDRMRLFGLGDGELDTEGQLKLSLDFGEGKVVKHPFQIVDHYFPDCEIFLGKDFIYDNDIVWKKNDKGDLDIIWTKPTGNPNRQKFYIEGEPLKAYVLDEGRINVGEERTVTLHIQGAKPGDLVHVSNAHDKNVLKVVSDYYEVGQGKELFINVANKSH